MCQLHKAHTLLKSDGGAALAKMLNSAHGAKIRRGTANKALSVRDAHTQSEAAASCVCTYCIHMYISINSQ